MTARYERGYLRISSNELVPQWRVERIIAIPRLNSDHVYVVPQLLCHGASTIVVSRIVLGEEGDLA